VIEALAVSRPEFSSRVISFLLQGMPDARAPRRSAVGRARRPLEFRRRRIGDALRRLTLAFAEAGSLPQLVRLGGTAPARLSSKRSLPGSISRRTSPLHRRCDEGAPDGLMTALVQVS
jgi:hypothetical protein